MEKLPEDRFKTALHIYVTKEELQKINDILERSSQTPQGKLRLGDVLRTILLNVQTGSKI